MENQDSRRFSPAEWQTITRALALFSGYCVRNDHRELENCLSILRKLVPDYIEAFRDGSEDAN